MCNKCKQKPRASGFLWCRGCRAYDTKRYHSVKSAVLLKQKRKVSKAFYAATREDPLWVAYRRQNHDQWVRTLREEMIAAYGGKCNCCGEAAYEFLTLEHKRGNGSAHRAQFNGNTNGLYKDLQRRGWPKRDFTILCWNCNCASFKYKICPHKK